MIFKLYNIIIQIKHIIFNMQLMNQIYGINIVFIYNTLAKFNKTI